jgi:hypothetical protein
MPASVHKAALVLDLFSVERPDWGPTEVADELRIAKSTAHALLGELTSVGLTERLPCGRYRLGWRTLGLAQTKLATSGYREAITPTAPAGEPLRRDGPHHGMGARPRAVRRQSTPGRRCGRTSAACCRAPDAAGNGAARGASRRSRQRARTRRARAHAPTRVRGRGSARPRRGGLRRRSGTHERRAGDRCPRAMRPA